MKYMNEYDSIVERVRKVLPSKIDDAYVTGRQKFENGKPGGAYTLDYGWSLCGQDVSNLDLSELSEENFRKLSFDTNTKFSLAQIKKFNPSRVLELGKRVGLGIELLHRAGIDGTGVNVAVIDTNFDIANAEMNDEHGYTKVKLFDNEAVVTEQMRENDGFHGKTVTSLLCGTNVGIAPHSNLYFFASEFVDDEQITTILEKIKTLNENGTYISAISMSASLQDRELNDEYTKTLAHHNCAFLSSRNFWQSGFDYMNRDSEKDIDDPNNFSFETPIDLVEFPKEAFELHMQSLRQNFDGLENYIVNLYSKLEASSNEEERATIKEELESKEELMSTKDKMLSITYEEYCQDVLKRKENERKNKLYIACGGRTYPQIGDGYKYCGHSSASWAIPQVAGLYVLARQLDPFLSLDEFSAVSKETCYKNENGYNVINPIGIAMKINELNQVKAQNDKRYTQIFEYSSGLISKLSGIIQSEKGFKENLRDNVNQTTGIDTLNASPKDKNEQML